MNNRILTIIGVITVFLIATNVYAGTCTRSDLIKAVDHAVGLINSKGKAALPELKKFRFCGDEGYIFVVEMSGKKTMHPIQKSGQGYVYVAGSKGEYFGAEMKAKAEKDGFGWIAYTWENPTTKKLDVKCTSY